MQLKVARKEEAGVDRAFITAVPRDNHAWTSMAFIKIAITTRLLKNLLAVFVCIWGVVDWL